MTEAPLRFPPPTVAYLRSFVPSASLRQKNSLYKAARMWVTAQSLYSNGLQLKYPITHADWYQKAITEQQLFNDGLGSRNTIKTTQKVSLDKWLFEMGEVNPEEWIRDYCHFFDCEREEVNQLLQGCPFESESRNETFYKRHLSNDFKALVALDYLISTPKNKKINQFCTCPVLPRAPKGRSGDGHYQPSQEPTSTDTPVNSSDLAELLVTYKVPVNGVRRFFMALDYIVSEYKGDTVSRWQRLLYEDIWTAQPVPMVQIHYDSASTGEVKDLITYPVAIYYSKRASYLSAYGQTPHHYVQEAHWYNFRLDRVLGLSAIPWPQEDADDIPEPLLAAYRDHSLPTPDHIAEQMDLAWGFDICLPISKLLLRFPRAFHDLYIHDSDRHETFEALDNVLKINTYIEGLPIESIKQKRLKERVKRHGKDAFYGADFRETDNNILMRLRAWGPNVEVLYPETLRARIIEDLRKNAVMYEEKRL